MPGTMLEVEVTWRVSTVLDTVSTVSVPIRPPPRSVVTRLVSTLDMIMSGVPPPSLGGMWSRILSRVMSPLT